MQFILHLVPGPTTLLTNLVLMGLDIPGSRSQVLLHLLSPSNSTLVSPHPRGTPLPQAIDSIGKLVTQPLGLDLLERIQMCFEREGNGPRLWEPTHCLQLDSNPRLQQSVNCTQCQDAPQLVGLTWLISISSSSITSSISSP